MIKEIKPKAAPKVRKPAKIKKEVEVKETAEKEVKEVEGIKKEVKEMKTETADKIEIPDKAETAEKTEKTEKIEAVEAVNAVEEGESAEEENGKNPKSNRYYEAVGRRKTAIARVRLFTRGDKSFIINDKPLENYFPGPQFRSIIEAPLIKMNIGDRFKITAVVKGGGTNSQAEAVRHGIARALVMFNLDFKKRLKKSGYLTRDSRMKERKKPGLRKARRAPQWAKR